MGGVVILLTEDSFHQAICFYCHCIFFYTQMVLISRKSSKILMVPIIGKYMPRNKSYGSGPWVCPFMMSEKTPLTPRNSVTWVFSE